MRRGPFPSTPTEEPSQVAKYANNQARSKVGNAVRRGAAAHDYDDDVDGDAKKE